jgi:hypothetical protein
MAHDISDIIAVKISGKSGKFYTHRAFADFILTTVGGPMLAEAPAIQDPAELVEFDKPLRGCNLVRVYVCDVARQAKYLPACPPFPE